MSDTPSPSTESALASALQRLVSAIDILDAAASRRLAADRNEAARAMELELMRGDRAKLAELLDQALARGRALEAAQTVIATRVDRAIELVASALEQAREPGREG